MTGVARSAQLQRVDAPPHMQQLTLLSTDKHLQVCMLQAGPAVSAVSRRQPGVAEPSQMWPLPHPGVPAADVHLQPRAGVNRGPCRHAHLRVSSPGNQAASLAYEQCNDAHQTGTTVGCITATVSANKLLASGWPHAGPPSVICGKLVQTMR